MFHLYYTGPAFPNDYFSNRRASTVCTATTNRAAVCRTRFWTKFPKLLFCPATLQATSSSISSIENDDDSLYNDVNPYNDVNLCNDVNLYNDGRLDFVVFPNSLIETQATRSFNFEKNGVLFNKVKLKGVIVCHKIYFCTYLIRLLYFCNLSSYNCIFPETLYNFKVNKSNNKYIQIKIVEGVNVNLNFFLVVAN